MIGYIYKLFDNEKFYIGSTSNLTLRMRRHKSPDGNTNIDFSNCKIVIVETVEYENIKELRQVEQNYLDKCKDDPLCCNKIRAVRTREQLLKEAKQNCKKWRLDNPEKYKELNKKFSKASQVNNAIKITCECGAVVSKGHIQRHLKSKKHKHYIASQHL